MNKRKKHSWQIFTPLVIVTCLCMAPLAHALIITPSSTIWKPDLQGKGMASILPDNPRSGDASLAIEVTGDVKDWAFYRRNAGDMYTSSWGLLSQIDSLSFDWYRKQVPIQSQYQTDVPWLAQTPVLNLYIRDVNNGIDVFSRLVWEKYYTDSSPALTNTWVTQDIATMNMWRYVDGAGYTVTGGANEDPFYPDPLLATSLASWLTYYSDQAQVYGISVGLGSYWPDQYVGYVDNVVLGFRGQDSFAVNDNFELEEGNGGEEGSTGNVVPEPSSIALMVGGCLLMLIARFIRKSSQS